MKELTLNEWSAQIHEVAREKGWWSTGRGVPETLCLIHSEVSEALEAYRANDQESFAEELGDILIRTLDAMAAYGLDPNTIVSRKHAHNKKRPFRHGGKRC